MTRIEQLLQKARATVQASEAHEVKRQALKVEVDTLATKIDKMVKSLELTTEEKALLEFPENK